jgi:hypothetical protein
MTGLTAFNPETETVQFPGGSFTVRGLALDDFSVLLREHYPVMQSLFEEYVREAALNKVDSDVTGGLLGLSDMKSVVLETLRMAPALIGDTIALASDEYDTHRHTARLLPTGIQIEAVGKVVSLTLKAEGGLEKMVETITQLVATLTTAMPDRSP